MSRGGRRIGLERRLYGVLLGLHPKRFRREFGPEMAWDFEDALRDGKAAAFYWDGVLSLGRQWMLRAGSAGVERRMAPAAGLLKGQYAVVDVDRLTPFELLRGAIVSSAMISVLALVPSRVARSAVQPANAVGMRGRTAAGTRSMQRGGEGSGDGAVRTAVVVKPATQPASASDLITAPAEVAEATAEALSGVPGRTQAGMAAVVVEKPRFAEFDVISVRENRRGGETTSNFPLGPNDLGYPKTGGVFRVTNLSLPGYIAFAYKLNSSQNSAMREQVPDWARTTRYDIEGRVDGEPTKDEMRQMVRALLADRFRLQVHTEEKEAAVFDLEMVKPGKVGAGMTVHAADDPECKRNVPAYFGPCGAMAVSAVGVPVAKMAGQNVTVTDFADFSGTPAGRMVLDKTELSGRWDVVVDFSLDGAARTDASGPAFADALRQQLGLKLVPGKAMVQTYVVDGVEPPTQN